MKKLTKREYYDLLVKCATDGTFPSMWEDKTTCAYRGMNGSRCAVGILIPDEKYHEEMEGNSVFDLDATLVADILPDGITHKQLAEIQGIHDTESVKEWDSTRFIYRINKVSCFREYANG